MGRVTRRALTDRSWSNDKDRDAIAEFLRGILTELGLKDLHEELEVVKAITTGSRPGVCLITEESGQILGVLIADPCHEPTELFIRWLVVHPALQRQGIGSTLVDALERTPGISRLSGMVDHTDRVALAFWRSRGWTTRRPRPGRRRQLMHRELGSAVSDAA